MCVARICWDLIFCVFYTHTHTHTHIESAGVVWAGQAVACGKEKRRQRVAVVVVEEITCP